MPLTRAQKQKIEEIKTIAELTGVDFWNIDRETDSEVRNILLDLYRDRFVRAGIVSNYVLIDELLTDIMCQHFFDPRRSSIELWRTVRFRNFNYYIVEELSLLRKLALVKAIRRIPRPVEETIRFLNLLRNAIAH